MPKCIILSGIPCSGKSTWANKQNLPIVSCDKIREELFGKKYKQNRRDEERVWDVFYFKVAFQTFDFIVDNTNCKLVYINRIADCLNQGEVDMSRIIANPITNALVWEIEIKRFDCSLYLAYYRNVIRWISEDKFIPFFVIKNMYFNYKKLWNL